MSAPVPQQFVKFKTASQIATIVFMHPLIVSIMFDMAFWCFLRKIKFVVTDTTSTYKKDMKLGRLHDGHRTKRAFDLRSWTFSKAQRIQFIEHFNQKYRSFASLSESDLEPRLVVLHGEGDNEHFHICIHAKFRLYV